MLHNFTAMSCDLIYVPALSYHLLSADIYLFNPKMYHKLHAISTELDNDIIKKQQGMSI